MSLRADADTMSLNGRGNGHLVPGLSGGDRRRVHYIALPTNLLISAHPDYLMFHRLIPHSAGRATVECSWHFPQSVAAAQDFDPSFASDFWDLTNIQDFAACESVTRGMRSGGFRPGVFDIREDGDAPTNEGNERERCEREREPEDEHARRRRGRGCPQRSGRDLPQLKGIEDGADLVIHSATKYLDGQGRCVGGACGPPPQLMTNPRPTKRL